MVSPTGTGDGDATDDGAPVGDAVRERGATLTDPSEVAIALVEYGDGLATAVESALAGRSGVVAYGVPLGLLPSILEARKRTDDGAPWRIACRPGAVDALGRALVLGTDAAEAVADGSIVLRTLPGDEGLRDVASVSGSATVTGFGSLVFATPDRADAVAGPRQEPTLLSETGDSTATAVFHAATTRFEAATPATVSMPSRTGLLAAAREVLDDRFATDLAAVLDGLDYGELGRSGAVADRTLLVALAARHDQLFRDLRRWIDGEGAAGGASERDVDRVAVAPSQELTDDRRALVRRELIESIKVPMGPGRPKLRLRAVDEALLRARPTEVLSVLRGRFALPLDESGTLRRGADGGGRRPVWDR
ncbi:transcriptional regulator TbsP domain-containing protein [Halorubrum sp. HHNYT27]|uniref:transcriptional regulator TbsP domain-containing protein n=1 Tax=Halorubrum sp. HHNYT27 TaxID=3402275 RepID=UPI003EBCE3B0